MRISGILVLRDAYSGSYLSMKNVSCTLYGSELEVENSSSKSSLSCFLASEPSGSCARTRQLKPTTPSEIRTGWYR